MFKFLFSILSFFFISFGFLFEGQLYGARGSFIEDPLEKAVEDREGASLSDSSVGGMDADGWVKLDRQERFPHVHPEDSGKVWVVFSKQLAGEQFFIRFPKDPLYEYVERGVSLHAELGKEIFRLTAANRLPGEKVSDHFNQRKGEILLMSEVLLVSEEAVDEETFDLVYRIGDRWIRERFQGTPFGLYFFHTESDFPSENSDRKFIDSLVISPL